MVIKSKIYDFLKKNLGEYLYGFEKNQLDVGLLSGHIELVNVNFRPDKVNELMARQGLPVHIKAGLIGKLKLKCNYISFLTSPVELEIDELLLVFGPISQMYKEQKINEVTDSDMILWQLSKENEILNYGKRKRRNPSFPEFLSASESEVQKPKNKKSSKKMHTEKNTEGDTQKTKRRKNRNSKIIYSADDEILDPSTLKPNTFSFEERLKHDKQILQENSYKSPPKKKSFLEKYFTKVLRNLKLKAKSIYVIYEDDTYSYENPLSIGMSIESLDIKNISYEWTVNSGKPVKVQSKNKTSIKDVQVNNFSIFIYSMASIIIPVSLYEETINSPIGIFEAFPAYEVRDLIINQCKFLTKKHPSTFLSPTSGMACISFSEEFPNIRAVGFIEAFSCKFTPAMGECLRNFYDYCTNVQIWPLALRYRPIERIPPKPPKREHRKQRKLRKEIINKWFQYAFMFVKLKIAALKYVHGRRKDREAQKKREDLQKIKEKIFKRSIQKTVVEKKEVAKENSTLSSIFSFSRSKNEPGKGMLAGIIGGINGKKPPIVQKQGKRPYDGDEYFTEALCNTELELHINVLNIEICDEDSKTSFVVSCTDFFKCTTTLLDEMNSIWTIQELCLTLLDHHKSTELFRCSGNKKNKQSTSAQALKGKLTYRPSELLVPNDIYNTLNMYEYSIEIGTFTANYSNKLMTHIFNLKQSISLDKDFRQNANEDFIKALIKKNKASVQVLMKKDKKKIAAFDVLGMYLNRLESWIGVKINDANSNFSVILFNAEVVLHGGEVKFEDPRHGCLLSVGLPCGKFEAGKSKENLFLALLGFRVRSCSTPAGIFEFCTVFKNLIGKQLKRIRKLVSFKA